MVPVPRPRSLRPGPLGLQEELADRNGARAASAGEPKSAKGAGIPPPASFPVSGAAPARMDLPDPGLLRSCMVAQSAGGESKNVVGCHLSPFRSWVDCGLRWGLRARRPPGPVNSSISPSAQVRKAAVPIVASHPYPLRHTVHRRPQPLLSPPCPSSSPRSRPSSPSIDVAGTWSAASRPASSGSLAHAALRSCAPPRRLGLVRGPQGTRWRSPPPSSSERLLPFCPGQTVASHPTWIPAVSSCRWSRPSGSTNAASLMRNGHARSVDARYQT